MVADLEFEPLLRLDAVVVVVDAGCLETRAKRDCSDALSVFKRSLKRYLS